MAEVFISYARANEDVARRVASGLKASGFEAWWDDQLPTHRAYTDIIEQRLRSAAAVVVLWSKDAAQSQWVRAEADFARTENKLVQAQLDGTLPPMPFNQIQCADLTSWRGNRKHRGWTKLVDGVTAVVSGASPQATEPAPVKSRLRMDRRSAMAAMAMLLLLVVAAIFFLPRMIGSSNDKPPRVAVLPFKNIGGSDEGLVAGIWEDTRHALSRNPQLVVLGPNTSKEIAEMGSAAARKAADYLVEASVRTSTGRVRINTSLVRSKDGAQIWSQTFDRKLDDVFALQSEIAQLIEGRIRGRLARGGGVKPENIATTGEVYALYSDARRKIRDREVARYIEAMDQLKRVVAMDPNFAPGWATLSVATAFGINQDAAARAAAQGQKTATPASARDDSKLAESYARRAIALAPNLAAGYAALGFALEGKGPTAQSALRKAIALDPSDVEATNWLAASLDPEEQYSEKLALFSKILEIEPLWWPAILNRLAMYLDAGNFAEGERERQRLERLGSTLMAGMVGIETENVKGNFSEAARIGITTFNAVPPDKRGVLGYSLAFTLLKLGYFEEVEENFTVPPPSPYLWRNDPRGLDVVEAMNLSPRQFFTSQPMADAACRVYMLSGRGGQLAKMYRSVASSPSEFQAVAGESGLAALGPTIALALRQTGDRAGADRLLAAAGAVLKASLKRAKGPRMAVALDEAYLARVYAAQGRKDEALRYLEAAVQTGWIPDVPLLPTDLLTDPSFALLKGEPRFVAARQKILDRVKLERAELGHFSLSAAEPKN
ncbi:MAG TPA: TIR domain-containing protein [Sphingomicrobium sp.]|nr:TIR domain-containing protein [Sphingomicrobium sp.]